MAFSAPTIVLMYHRVAELAHDVHDMAVHPDRFDEHVDRLRRKFRVVPLVEARQPALLPRVVITFDDGYTDNVQVAAPALVEAGLPATFFVTAGMVGSDDQTWFDELELVMSTGTPRVRHLEVEIAGRALLIDLYGTDGLARAHAALHRRLRPLRHTEIRRVLEQVRRQIHTEASAETTHRFMSPTELQCLADSPGLEVGAHGMTHQQLSSLDEAEQRVEVVDARHRLREITGSDVSTMAYPFGGPETFDEVTERLVGEAGYELACAGWPGPVRRATPPTRLPRYVVRDWGGDELASAVEHWFREHA